MTEQAIHLLTISAAAAKTVMDFVDAPVRFVGRKSTGRALCGVGRVTQDVAAPDGNPVPVARWQRPLESSNLATNEHQATL